MNEEELFPLDIVDTSTRGSLMRELEVERAKSKKLLEVIKRFWAMGVSCLPLDKLEVEQWAHRAIKEYEASR